jgi:multiple sugar transport system substrate-binding protein
MALDKYIAKDKDFNLDVYFPVAAQSVHYRGKVYALPDNGSPVALVYNKEMFDEYNREHPKGPKLEYPNEKWTWDDFRHAAKALTKDIDGDGYTDVFGASVSFWRNRWPILVWQYGGDLLSKDKKRCLMDTPQAIEGVTVLHDIMWVDKSSPTVSTVVAGASQQGAGVLFQEQHIAMLMDTRYGYINLKGKTKFVWDIAPLPKGPAGRQSLYISDVWMVSSKTKYPEQSWRLAKFLVSKESNRMCMASGRSIVSHQKVAEEILRNPEPGSGLPEHDYRWVEIMLDSRAKDFEYREMGRYLAKAMDEMTAISRGRDKAMRTPEEACRNFTRLYQKGLDILWKEEGGP